MLRSSSRNRSGADLDRGELNAMKRFLFVLLVLSGLTGFSRSVSAQGSSDRPLIAVFGQAEVMVAPDQVLFRVEAENIDPDIGKAKAQTDSDVKKVFALARAHNIAPQNVQTDFVTINRRYTDATQGKPRQFKGFAVSQRIVILLAEIGRFDALLADLVNGGITNLSEVTFRATQTRKHMDEARALAIRAAREKAVALAAEVGQKIGKAISIAEVGMTVTPAYDEDSTASNSNYSNTSAREISGNVADNQGTIAPGMISIIARVKVSFELN